MYILQAEKGAFIFPDKNRNEYSQEQIRTLPNWRELAGYDGKVNAFGLVIPCTQNYKSFQAQMRDVEKELMSFIN